MENEKYKINDNTLDICGTTIEPSDFFDGDDFNIRSYTESIEETCDESFHERHSEELEEICDESFNERHSEELEEIEEVIEWCYNNKEYSSIKECVSENY